MIALNIDPADFEYDTGSLIKEFFPDEDISVNGTGKHSGKNPRFRLDIAISGEDIKASFVSGDGTRKNRSVNVAGKNRLQTKNALKRLVYDIFSKETGKELAWGTLTGIRPVNLALTMAGGGLGRDEIKGRLRDDYLVSEKKAELCVSIAGRQEKILSGFDLKNSFSLYIDIPFCPSRCLYCSFTSNPISSFSSRLDDYLDALFKELSAVRDVIGERKICSVYIGGGTPTALDEKRLERLLSFVGDSFDVADLSEFCVEAGRPDSLSKGKLDIMREHGVSRISINPQTMNERTLKVIGRNHTPEDVLRAFELARDEGFSNINADIIAGLPGESADDFLNTLSEIERIHPESLTVHSFARKRAAEFNIRRDEYAALKTENSDTLMDAACESAGRMGMSPYYLYRQKNMAGNLENTGYSRPGLESIYNIVMMENRQHIAGAGPGASSKIVFCDGRKAERLVNPKNVDIYIQRIDEIVKKKREFLSTI